MIKQPTLDFLADIAHNNHRDWFLANKERYEEARNNVTNFAAGLIKLVHKIDPGIGEDLDVKKCVMRIYRDVRFSKNKAPYKNNFGIGLSSTGSKPGGVEYYMQIQPGNSFIAGGYWMPEAAHLKAIRQEIDYNAAALKAVIDDPAFVKLFGGFREQEKLKTTPKEYSADNENIELLKLKSFVVSHSLSDKVLLKKDSVETVADLCSRIYPLNVFLKNALN